MTADDNAPDTAPDTGQTLDTAPSNLPPGIVWQSLRRDQKASYARQTAVLEAYRVTGTLSEAARTCGLTPRAAYRWEEEDTMAFRSRLALAVREHGESMVDLMRSRLTDPTGNRGSDVLLMFYLKSWDPQRFKESSAIQDSTARDLLSELRKRGRIKRQASGDEEPTPVEEAERLLANRNG